MSDESKDSLPYAAEAEEAKETAAAWARDFAAQAGVEVVPLIEVVPGVTRVLFEYHFDRLSEFAAAKVIMRLIDKGQEVTVRKHADMWIRVSVSVPWGLITPEKVAEGTGE